ncbi:transcription repressor NadR [Tepidanaerobacter sp. EBM-38]|mgnify:CR=1 FL=1|uniref:transcription repressor NadR n=1 Tax=Tepidanaerobacter sp. EBM-38 TaxID=1918496 RepID=UPI000A7AB577|nr:transcription repressor NadR [Tepidanaerobacter sp. EBM-38]
MNTEIRRERIIKLLNTRHEPISGNELAKIFGVTRQVIVQDIAILRASGKDIISTSQGYLMKSPLPVCTKQIAVCHKEENTREELLTFIECGCKVIDVIVEHPLYGELHGLLMLSNSKDVDNFIQAIKKHKAKLLSQLTNGVHLHTVEAINFDCINKAERLLKEKGMLLE